MDEMPLDIRRGSAMELTALFRHPAKFAALFLTLLIGQGVGAAAPEPLHLTNGRIFENWTVIGETSTQITIKYAGGAAKVDKKLLPAAVLLKYPVVAEKPEDTVAGPPGLQKQSAAERHLDLVGPTGEVTRWSVSAGEVPSLMKFAKFRQSGRTATSKQEASFLLNLRDIGAMLAVLNRIDRWTAQARQSMPAEFEKSLGKVGDDEWTFTWKPDGSVTVFTGEAFLHDKDFGSVAALVGAVPVVFAEKVRELRAAIEFSDSLK